VAAVAWALSSAGAASDDIAASVALRGLHEAHLPGGAPPRAAAGRAPGDRGPAAGPPGAPRPAYLGLGRTLHVQGEYQHARAHLERSVALADAGADRTVPWPVPLAVSAPDPARRGPRAARPGGEAADVVDSGIRRSRSHPPFAQATARSMSSHVAVLHRDTAVAGERTTAALDLADRWHVRSMESYARTVLGLCRRWGRPGGSPGALRRGLTSRRAAPS
jgi:hypothetical protein